MSEHLYLFSADLIEEDFTPRQPLADILVHETGVLAPSYASTVRCYVALSSFDLEG